MTAKTLCFSVIRNFWVNRTRTCHTLYSESPARSGGGNIFCLSKLPSPSICDEGGPDRPTDRPTEIKQQTLSLSPNFIGLGQKLMLEPASHNSLSLSLSSTYYTGMLRSSFRLGNRHARKGVRENKLHSKIKTPSIFRLFFRQLSTVEDSTSS